jgi:hypothetical protein
MCVNSLKDNYVSALGLIPLATPRGSETLSPQGHGLQIRQLFPRVNCWTSIIRPLC